ncbi:hypothetical protein [Bradyrhizobium sp. AZCC 2230]|uniref:hypothetical protein n=1 Tax=Bradyrhizobium sp. AZCC 2230 TaxID=3117021 RepID=UPI002FF35454
MIAIDRMNLGSPPTGFFFARTGQGPDGAWTVVSDPTAPSGRAIEQTSTGGVGLWTKADSVTRFDQISIKTIPTTGN